MEFSEGTWWLIALIFAGAVTIIGFFLKRTISQTDNHDKAIKEIQLTYVTKSELKEVKDSTQRTLDKQQKNIEEIKDQMLTKADFFRMQTKTDNKIDKIYDLLIQQRAGGNGNGERE